jgi:hypothetical protein
MTHFARGRILIGNQKSWFCRANRNYLYRLELPCSHLPCVSPIDFRQFRRFSLRFPLPSRREQRFQIASRYEPSLALRLIFQRAIANQFAHMSDRNAQETGRIRNRQRWRGRTKRDSRANRDLPLTQFEFTLPRSIIGLRCRSGFLLHDGHLQKQTATRIGRRGEG